MCTVSNLGDGWTKDVPQRYPWVYPNATPNQPSGTTTINFTPQVSRDEFLALKREVEELRKLLLAAKAFDEATGQPDCEVDEKVELIKKIAEIVGVDLGDVFTKNA